MAAKERLVPWLDEYDPRAEAEKTLRDNGARVAAAGLTIDDLTGFHEQALENTRKVDTVGRAVDTLDRYVAHGPLEPIEWVAKGYFLHELRKVPGQKGRFWGLVAREAFTSIFPVIKDLYDIGTSPYRKAARDASNDVAHGYLDDAIEERVVMLPNRQSLAVTPGSQLAAQ
ncbi:MAG: hypothetical protein OXR66_06325 [Candidatus Woesearchaeota archaeon]|nr:hypothetical protein [Candidatus Woesearchaeota archaeon]